MEDIVLANRINKFMPYNYDAMMKPVERTKQNSFPTTLPRTVPRGFISNRPPSLLGTSAVSVDKGTMGLKVVEATRNRTNAFVREFGRGETIAGGLSGKERTKRKKLLKEILAEQARIRDAGIGEVKEIIRRLQNANVISEREVLVLAQAGYDRDMLLNMLNEQARVAFDGGEEEKTDLDPGSAYEADEEIARALEDLSDEASMVESEQNPFRDDEALGGTLRQKMAEQDKATQELGDAPFMPPGANEAGVPSPHTPRLSPRRLSSVEVRRSRRIESASTNPNLNRLDGSYWRESETDEGGGVVEEKKTE
jgi:hypothetical protein